MDRTAARYISVRYYMVGDATLVTDPKNTYTHKVATKAALLANALLRATATWSQHIFTAQC